MDKEKTEEQERRVGRTGTGAARWPDRDYTCADDKRNATQSLLTSCYVQNKTQVDAARFLKRTLLA